LSVVTTETASRLIEDLVATYLAGLPHRPDLHPQHAVEGAPASKM
jgi:hypothetical protein